MGLTSLPPSLNEVVTSSLPWFGVMEEATASLYRRFDSHARVSRETPARLARRVMEVVATSLYRQYMACGEYGPYLLTSLPQ